MYKCTNVQMTGVPTVENTDGRPQVFVRGTDKALWHLSQTCAWIGAHGECTKSGRVFASDPRSRC